MAKFAGALAQLNVGKGDRVVIYMPMVPQVLSIMHSIMVHHVPLISASMRVKFNLFTQYHGSCGGGGEDSHLKMVGVLVRNPKEVTTLRGPNSNTTH